MAEGGYGKSGDPLSKRTPVSVNGSKAVEQAVVDNDLVAAAVLSGNRNFEARIHQNIKANFLMSPPLVVAFALAGRVDIDLAHEPIGTDEQGKRGLFEGYLACWEISDRSRGSTD